MDAEDDIEPDTHQATLRRMLDYDSSVGDYDYDILKSNMSVTSDDNAKFMDFNQTMTTVESSIIIEPTPNLLSNIPNTNYVNHSLSPKKRPTKPGHLPVVQSGVKKPPMSVGSMIRHFNTKPLENKTRGSVKVVQPEIQAILNSSDSDYNMSLGVEDISDTQIEKRHSAVSTISTISLISSDSILNSDSGSKAKTKIKHQASIDDFAHQIHIEQMEQRETERQFSQSPEEMKSRSPMSALADKLQNQVSKKDDAQLTKDNSNHSTNLEEFISKTPKIPESYDLDTTLSMSKRESVPLQNSSLISKKTMLTLRQDYTSEHNQFRLKFYLPRNAADVNDCQLINMFVRPDCTVKKVKTILELKYPHQVLKSKIKALYVADSDGEMDDDFPPISDDRVITELGITNFYIQREFDRDTLSVAQTLERYARSSIPEHQVKEHERNNMLNSSTTESRILRRDQPLSRESFERESLLAGSRSPTTTTTIHYNTFHEGLSSMFCCCCCGRSPQKERLLLNDESNFSDSEELGDHAGRSSRSSRRPAKTDTKTKNEISTVIRERKR